MSASEETAIDGIPIGSPDPSRPLAVGLTSAPTGRIHLAHEPSVRLGVLDIEPALRRVSHDDGREELVEPRVMQVLIALIRAGGQIVSRDDLLMSCWYGVVVGEDAINRVMSRVRRLADGIGDGEIKLETVTKVGYRLVASEHSAGDRPKRSSLATPHTPLPAALKPVIAVLPFANLSGEPDQAYFSEGISEDILTDLGKVSSLSVVARHGTFGIKRVSHDVREAARLLGASHILEGSVRKVASRVRITAQLADSATNEQVWAERWDRDLDDIFAVQDEISREIVRALKLRLAHEDENAIERRGTRNVEAYEAYLLARARFVRVSRRSAETVIGLCQRAVSLDPNYAAAWALMARGYAARGDFSAQNEAAWAAADRALACDPNLAEAHAVKGRLLTRAGRYEEAKPEIDLALQLDPESADANRCASAWAQGMQRMPDSARYLEAVGRIDPTDFYALSIAAKYRGMMGETSAAERLAREAIACTEAVIAQESDNVSAMCSLACALAVLGEGEQARTWADRAVRLEPDDFRLRYNLACDLAAVADIDYVLGLLEKALTSAGPDLARFAVAGMGFDDVTRANPRYKTIIAQAQVRWENESGTP